MVMNYSSSVVTMSNDDVLSPFFTKTLFFYFLFFRWEVEMNNPLGEWIINSEKKFVFKKISGTRMWWHSRTNSEWRSRPLQSSYHSSRGKGGEREK
jgi:hypothetical protein